MKARDGHRIPQSVIEILRELPDPAKKTFDTATKVRFLRALSMALQVHYKGECGLIQIKQPDTGFVGNY